jgi:hypothetical protein
MDAIIRDLERLARTGDPDSIARLAIEWHRIGRTPHINTPAQMDAELAGFRLARIASLEHVMSKTTGRTYIRADLRPVWPAEAAPVLVFFRVESDYAGLSPKELGSFLCQAMDAPIEAHGPPMEAAFNDVRAAASACWPMSRDFPMVYFRQKEMPTRRGTTFTMTQFRGDSGIAHQMLAAPPPPPQDGD